jgi:hypothetical protein
MSHTVIATAARNTQVVQSNDEIWTIDELIKRRAAELGNAPLLAYPRTGLTDFEEHSASALDRYADAAVDVLQRRGLQKVVCAAESQSILATSPINQTLEGGC